MITKCKPIVACPPGALDDNTKTAIRRAGYLIVETLHPESIKTIQLPPETPDYSRLKIESVAMLALSIVADEGVKDFYIRDVFRRRIAEIAAGKELNKARTETKG